MSEPVESSNFESLDSASQTDAIADVLMGGDTQEKLEVEEPTDEAAEVETEEGSSEDEETPSEEQDEPEAELSEEAEGDDTTWEGVLGLDEEQLSFDDSGNLKGVVVKVNGEASTVGIKDLVAGYQTNKAVTQKSQALAEAKRLFEEQEQQVTAVYQDKLETVGTLVNVLSDQIVGEYNSIDWDALRAANPAEYAAARQDYAARAKQLEQAKEAVKAERDVANTEASAKQQAQYAKHIEQQKEIMLANNPTWNDEKAYKQDMSDIKGFLSNQYGFSDEDFAAVADARLIELVKDAKAYHSGVQSVQEKLRKPVPKFQKSGSGAKRKTATKLDKLTNAAMKAKGSKKRDAQSNAVAELLMGD